MKTRMLTLATLVAAAVSLLSTGCSSAPLTIMLDGKEGSRDIVQERILKKPALLTISDPIECKPKLKFTFSDPKHFGRITMVQAQIHQKVEADYSHLAEYVIISKDVNNSEAQMKPDTEYDLGAPPDFLRIMDVNKKDVPGVELKPGVEYMISVSVVADHSETANVYFKTK